MLRTIASVIFSLLLYSVQSYAQADERPKGLENIDKDVFNKANVHALCDARRNTVIRKRLLEILIVSGGQSAISILNPGDNIERQLAHYVDTADEAYWIKDALRSWLAGPGNSLFAPDRRLTSESDPVDVYLSGKYQISCKAEDKNSTVQTITTVQKAIANRVVIRGAVSDLKDPAHEKSGSESKLAETSSANWKFSDDQLKHKFTNSGEGVFGVMALDTGYSTNFFGQTAPFYSNLQIIPFVYAKQSITTPISTPNNSIDILEPGIDVNYNWASNTDSFLSSFRLQLEEGSVIDQTQKSREWVSGQRWSPSFSFGDGGYHLFGERIVVPALYLAYLAQLDLIAREHSIEARGTNPIFQHVGYYTGLGFEGRLQVFGYTGIDFFDSIKAYADYLEVENSSGVASVKRTTYGLSYTLPGTDKLTVNLDYANGRDPNTLQNERKLTTGLGIKF